MGAVVVLSLVALDLHCVCEDASYHEWLGLQVDVLHLLKPLQSSFFTHCIQVGHEVGTDAFVSAQLFVRAVNASLLGKVLHELFVRHSDGDDKTLSAFSMNEYFSEFVALEVGVFDLFGSHIFTLLQLEDVLFAIYDADGARLGTHRTYITSLQPSVRSNRLLSLGLIVVVAHKHTWPASPNLSTRGGVTLSVLISGKVVHFGNVD